MTFYLLKTGFSTETQERTAQLEIACQQRGITCVTLESTTADHLALPTLLPGDVLYNATRDGMRLEELMWRPGVATFYSGNQPPRGIQDTTRWLAAHSLAGLSQPRTITHATADKKLLTHYVEYLGGFPIIVKVAGGSRGTGVMRVDTWPALFSLTDYLAAMGADFILREYIKNPGSARLFVINRQVVASLQYNNPFADFRANALAEGADPRLTSFSPEVEALAVAAVETVGVELGGVDIVFDEQKRPYLLEMNFPSGFIIFPKLGVDIPGMIVEYLTAKATHLLYE